jgi:phospholipase C
MRGSISRRFLGLAGIVLVAGCAAPSGGAAAPAASPQAMRHPGGSASQYLSHLIVIIQENRSFENFFAGYPGANAPTSGCAIPQGSRPRALRVRPAMHHLSSGSGCPAGDVSVPLAQVTFTTNPDIQHNWKWSMTEWNNGNMDGFSAWGPQNGQYQAYDYIDRSEVQPYWTMAQQYVLADEMFPTEFGGSFTGHLTLVAGTDDIQLPGRAEVNFPSAAPDDCDSPPGTKSSYVSEKPYHRMHLFKGPFPCFDQFNTMAQVLDNANVSWKMYATRVLDAGFWEPFEAIKYVRHGADWSNDIIAPQTQVLNDATYGNLASVSWVTPSKPDSDHPHALSDQGPSWVSSVVNAVGESAYWPTSAIIVVWDDWGGFYDNAAPPQLDYRGLGVRVPCLIISPYAKQGYVSHVQYEFGSILRFIEEVNGLPAGSIGPTSQGYTDARANSIDDAFDFTQQPRPFSPIPTKYPIAHFRNEPPSREPVDTE